MEIPVPCKFGEKAICDGKELVFTGVSWFKWSSGWEYTYFFATGDVWHSSTFYTSKGCNMSEIYTINDSLLEDKFIKEHDYQLKGRGYTDGLEWCNGKIYVDFIMTSNYLTHIKVQCNDDGTYFKNGDIIFPPSWDTEEKRENAILKSYTFYHGEPLSVEKPKYVQMELKLTI